MSEPGRFALVASAISGRQLRVDAAEPGAPAWTDGTTVFVDGEADALTTLVWVIVQAALLGAGSLQADVVRALRRRPALVRRYLAVEGHRALAAHEQVLPRPVRSLLDHGVAARSASSAQSLALAIAGAVPGNPPAAFGTIRPGHVHTTAGPGDDDDVLRRHVPYRHGVTELRHLDDDEDPGPVADFSSPVGGGGGIGRLLRRLFGDARSAGGGPPGADAPTHWQSRSPHSGRVVAISTRASPWREAIAPTERTGYRYPEWDHHQRAYKPNWCTVLEVEPPGSRQPSFTMPARQAFRRPLGRLGLEFERCRRQFDGDDLDVDAVVEAQVERRAGVLPDEALYVDSVRQRRDLSVLVLLDVSGSAGEPGFFGLSVHEHQRQVAAALVATLHELGDRVALYGFRSQGRSAVSIVAVKRFGDDLDERVFERLGGLVPGAYTRLGAAIRHSASVLEEQSGTARRLLVVLSDGFAYDHGYEPAYGEADARLALREVRRQGIGCLCLSVGAGADLAGLRRVFGTAAHAAVPRIEQVPSVVGPLFRAALATAEAQRKISIRRTRTSERLDIDRRSP